MIYFISDVHLGILEREKDIFREELLLDFFAKISTDCETLFIVGDLFDYWFEYKTVIPKYFYRTLSALAELKAKGIHVEFLMGNHDFGHLNFFETELGISIYNDDISRELYGKKFYLSHGDGKSYNDTGYKILKKVTRNPLAQWLYRKLHPDCGIPIASHSSRKSRDLSDSKIYGPQSGMEDFAKIKIDDGYDYVIMGHMHKPLEKAFGNGKFFVLGAWFNNPTFGMFDGESMQLLNVKEFLNKT